MIARSLVLLVALSPRVGTSSWQCYSPLNNVDIQRSFGVRLRSTSKLVRAITANTISLTPGTVIVSINSDTAMMEIHVLGKTASAEFQQAIRNHEDRVTAFIVEKT